MRSGVGAAWPFTRLLFFLDEVLEPLPEDFVVFEGVEPLAVELLAVELLVE
jgi:hypothetical protein